MEEVLLLNELYDYYGSLLTDKQKKYFEKYYFENLTMQEIAELEGVSKNAVSKQLDVIVKKLLDYERKLKLKSKKDKINNIINDLDDLIKAEIEKYL